jgi:hypothetical protein
VGSVNRYSAQREEILRERQAGSMIAERGLDTKDEKTRKCVSLPKYFPLLARG